MLFVSPLTFWRQTQSVFSLVKWAFLWISGLSSLLMWGLWSIRRRRRPVGFTVGYALAGYAAAFAIATALSQNPVLSFFGIYRRYAGLLSILLYTAIAFLIVQACWEEPKRLLLLVNASAAASVLIAAYVLIQAAGKDWLHLRTTTGAVPSHPIGTVGNSNFTGGFLGLNVPFLLFLAVEAKRKAPKIALGFASLVCVAGVWFTESRGGLVAATVGICTMAFLLREKLAKPVRIGAAALAALAGSLFVFVVWNPGSLVSPGSLERFDVFRRGSLEYRAYYWRTAWNIFLEYPLHGVGPEQYLANYTLFRPPEAAARLGLTLADKAHNIFLEHLATTGLLGFGAYIALLGTSVRYGLHRSRLADGECRLLAVTFLSVLAAYLAQGFFSIDVPPLAVAGWSAIAALVVLADPRLEAARLRSTQSANAGDVSVQQVSSGRMSWKRWAAVAALLAGYAALMPIAAFAVFADVKQNNAVTSYRAHGRSQYVDENVDGSIRLNPVEALYRATAGKASEVYAAQAQSPAAKKAHLEISLKRYREALRLQPGNITYTMNLARVYTYWALTVDKTKFSQAEVWWRKAVGRDPYDWEVHRKYAQMLVAYGKAFPNDRDIGDRAARERHLAVRLRSVSG